ncbi:ABC transporter permease [Puniceicoccales bacterium CK1056]|uniref:ABC transporter permease n=1 Tax=Oceanipulchritudo coccoides TaxID=2706888 RepID=A0A6B2LY33_9BACT|nr:ABC transporter permease [Oceanipulchritudo coccoides]NDV61521.1 ABC transporter permease [Oceanipulchritudo coccoides]
MRLPWYMYLALRQLAPSGRRLGSVFFFLSVLGVALGVAVLVIVQSVMGGFGQVHRERIIDTSGHLDVTEGGYPFQGGYALADAIREREDVVQVTPYARGFVMARSGNVPVFPAIYGLSYEENPVFAISPYLTAGSLDELYDDTVLISQSLAQQLGVWVGINIEVFSPVMIERLQSDEVVLPRELTVAGIYSIDWNQEFLPGILCTLRTMQDLYGLGDAVHGVAIRLVDDADEFAVASELEAELSSGKQVLTWKEKWADFLWVLDLEKTMMLFLNLFIVAVAAFAIAIAQLLTVVRKTREIGLLAVIGGSRTGVLGLYCFQGFFIGLLGAALGIGVALLALSFRDPIINLLAELTGSRDTLIQYYYFANLPVDFDVREITGIGLLATALATLASLLPAWRAARLKPAETLRIEQ